MITGFNTDIEHDGVVYHVQTEDKGLDSPLILSLVYSGGEILASKRSPYDDLIAAGFSEEQLAQRLKRQHRLICAAINAGRVEELKRMGRPGTAAATSAETEDAGVIVVESKLEPREAEERSEAAKEEFVVSHETAEAQPEELTEPAPVKSKKRRSKESAYTVYDSRRESPLGEFEIPEQGLAVTILGEKEFHAGDRLTLRILVEKRSASSQTPVDGASLSVKILGTTFRPQMYSVKTGRDGIGTIAAEIPTFTSGRAAILVRAASERETTEVRRVINPAR